MDQLPSTILNRIFIQLPFSQKKECLFVCRLWESIIKNQCLYHTLEISNKRSYQEFMDIMKQTPSLRKQVVDLAILVYWGSQDIHNDIIEYFPNLEHFSFTRRSSEELTFIDSQTTKSASKMRYIRDAGSCTLLRALAKAGLCSRLDELHVAYFDTNLVLPILNNMPALTHLSLERRYITIAQLEMLHKDLPTLEYIGVGIRFDNEDPNNDIPHTITPAVSITRMHVSMESVIDEDQTSWLFYVSKKYPNLKVYYLLFESNDYDEIDMEFFDYIYSVSYTPFLEALGPQLQAMLLPGAQFNNFKIFQKMDEHGCQIKTVSLDSDDENSWCLSLSQSKQSKYIQDLSIFYVKPCSFDWLKSMVALKSLHINFDSDSFKTSEEIDINTVFKSCSKTVKSITFNNANYSINGDFDEVFQIEEMRLDSGWAPVNISQFIADCLPNLHILSLNGSMMGNSDLILPKHHFSYVCLYVNGKAKHGNFALTIKKNSGRYLYRTKSRKTHVHMSHYDKFIKPIPQDNFNGNPFINLVFGSVRKLIIENYQVLLN